MREWVWVNALYWLCACLAWMRVCMESWSFSGYTFFLFASYNNRNRMCFLSRQKDIFWATKKPKEAFWWNMRGSHGPSCDSHDVPDCGYLKLATATKNENIKIRMNVIYLNICFFPSPVNLEKYISMLVLYIRFVVVFFFFLRTVIWKLKWSIVAIFAMAYTELLKMPQPMYVDDVIHFSRFYSE